MEAVGGRLVEDMAKALVDIPEQVQVQVREIRGTNVMIFELQVAPNERGQVIGRQGRLADAMRDILAAVSVKEHRWLKLKILE